MTVSAPLSRSLVGTAKSADASNCTGAAPSRKEEPNMRSIPVILAAFVAGPAAAQSWEEYSYPEYAFAVAFPANPQVEETTTAWFRQRSIRFIKAT